MTTTTDDTDTGWILTNLAFLILLIIAWLLPPKE